MSDANVAFGKVNERDVDSFNCVCQICVSLADTLVNFYVTQISKVDIHGKCTNKLQTDRNGVFCRQVALSTPSTIQ